MDFMAVKLCSNRLATSGQIFLCLHNFIEILIVMKTYASLVDRILRAEHLLERLLPTQPLDRALLMELRAAADNEIAGNRLIGAAPAFALVRGGLLYALDAIDEAHRIFQDSPGDLGSYWHGMMHRREGDFDNARYWFRRAGALAFFDELHGRVSEYSADMSRQSNWDPYLFTGQCEQARFGDTDLEAELVKLQRDEFEVLFDYCWRESRIQ